MPTSQNGFAVLKPDSRLLVDWNMPGLDERLKLRQGSVGFNLVFLATVFDTRIEDVDDNHPLDDWGYAYRPVRGFDAVWSNHASGTAMDINATEHPLGKSGTFSDLEVMKIHKLLRSKFMAPGANVPVIRWGGDYRNRKDEMHFEAALSMPFQEAVARRLMKSKRGQLILAANPGQKAVILA